MFVPSRLTAVRKRRGTSITSLSSASGISKASISAYENDKKVPSPETLERLARTLRVPVAYFSRTPLDEVPLAAVSFRAPSKMTARSRDIALQLASHVTELRQWIDEHYEAPDVDVPTLHRYTGTEAAADAAAVVRAKWGLGEAPLGNLVHLLELHGIAVFSAKADDGVFDAFSFRTDGRPYVLLNTAKSAERSRFDAAHELGHLVLHSEATDPTGVEAEREADAFASAFLMPESDIRAHSAANPRIDQILLKKRRWRVSAMALTYRLHDIGLLTDWLYHTTCVNLSRLGYRSGEPDGIERESSRLLSQVMTDLWSQRRGFEKLCHELAVESHDVNDLMFNLAPVAINGSRHHSPPLRPNLRVVTDGTLHENAKAQGKT